MVPEFRDEGESPMCEVSPGSGEVLEHVQVRQMMTELGACSV